MNPEELGEQTEQAHHSGQRGIGLTTAITAVLLAIATLLSHRAHTEEIKLQTKVNDEWNFYQAKHQRAHDYGKDAEIESAAGHQDLALEFLQVAIDEECGAPVENGCQAPRAKQSPILRKLAAELKAPSGNPDKAGSSEKAEKTAGAGATEAEKSEPAKTEAAKSEAGAEHAKPAKEGSASREGAVKIQDKARDMEKETEVITRRGDRFDSAELFLEVSIVLCSIALLAENKLYWKLSFISTAVGIATAIYGLILK
jgi:Domain of unknown function (DUF4337)